MDERAGAGATEVTEVERNPLALQTEVAYWKRQHARAREREEALKSELADTKARVRYLEGRLYGRHSERSSGGERSGGERTQRRRRRGGQPGSEGSARRAHQELEVREEVYDIGEAQKYCPHCGKPRKAVGEADRSERIEIEVKAYRRVMWRRKYSPGCRCEGRQGIITAAVPANLIPHSRYGITVWAHILLAEIPLSDSRRAGAKSDESGGAFDAGRDGR